MSLSSHSSRYTTFIHLVILQSLYHHGVLSTVGTTQERPALKSQFQTQTQQTLSRRGHRTEYRRQRYHPHGETVTEVPDEDSDFDFEFDKNKPKGGIPPRPGGRPVDDFSKFSTKSTTPHYRKRTTQVHLSLEEHCEYILQFCLRGFQTGPVCARSVYLYHMSFKNYCMLEFVNCMLRYELWAIAYMGECYYLKPPTEFINYNFHEDYVMYQYYVVEKE